MTSKTKLVLELICLGIFDALIPIPITVLILIYVIMQKPVWFLDVVREIYQ